MRRAAGGSRGASRAARQSGPLATRERAPNMSARRSDIGGVSFRSPASNRGWAMANYLRTTILLAGLTALFMGVGYLIGGSGGAIIALIIAGAMNLVSYWNADTLV